MDGCNVMEEYIEKPYWIIDILPKQVPANRASQYFKIEEYFLKQPQFGAICQKFSNLLIKISCYYDISLYNLLHEWVDNPCPDSIETSISSGKVVYVLLMTEDTMIGFNGDDHYMTMYNPNEKLIEFINPLANSEGLFVYQHDNIDIII